MILIERNACKAHIVQCVSVLVIESVWVIQGGELDYECVGGFSILD